MKKSLANIRFIGELYKCQILTDRKMHEIIRRLLLPIEPDENSVELLCCLLKSIGEKLELRTQQKISTGDVSNGLLLWCMKKRIQITRPCSST